LPIRLSGIDGVLCFGTAAFLLAVGTTEGSARGALPSLPRRWH